MEITIFKDLETELKKLEQYENITDEQLLNIIYNIAKHEHGHAATQADSEIEGDMMGWPGKTYDDYLEKRNLTDNDKAGVRRDFPPMVGDVGGFAIPVDKLTLLAPYIAVGSVILVATAIYFKRVKRRKA
jgi:hypothetical protein